MMIAMNISPFAPTSPNQPVVTLAEAPPPNVRFTPGKRHPLALSAWLLRRKWSLQSQRAWHNCDTRPDSKIPYNRGMNENLSRELLAWLTQAGLAGTPESDIFSVFRDRCVVAGIPLGRAHVAIDTLHPVHEGRLFRW